MTKNVARQSPRARGGRPHLVTSAVMAAALLTCCSQPTAAGTFKCMDAGRTVYSDQPCPGQGTSLDIPSRPALQPGKILKPRPNSVEVCFLPYAAGKDPAVTRVLESFVDVSAGGDATLRLDAVIPNKFGGTRRELLSCPLRSDLSVDTAKSSAEFVRWSQTR